MVVKPTTCEEMECDEGMVCEMRKRVKDGLEVPRCKPENPDATRAEDCSQLTCREGMVCEVLGSGQVKCMMIPPPTNCADLDCGEGMVCSDVGNKGRVRCVQESRRAFPATNSSSERPTSSQPPRRPLIERRCNELDCENRYRCRMIANRQRNGDRRLRPTCVPAQCSLRRRSRPPQCCAEVDCGKDEECVVCREGMETRARCQQRHKPDNDRETRPTRKPDEDQEKPTAGEGNDKKHSDTTEEDELTIQDAKTLDKDTPEEDEKTEDEAKSSDEDIPEEDEKTIEEAKTLDKDTSEEDNEDEENEEPGDRSDEDTETRRSRRRPPVTCEEVECGEEMCFEFEHDGRHLARCVSAGQFPSKCPSLLPLPFTLVDFLLCRFPHKL